MTLGATHRQSDRQAGEAARLFDAVASEIESAISGGRDTIVVSLESPASIGTTSGVALSRPFEPEATRAMLLAAARMERAMRRLHRDGGSLECRSSGAMSGALLEIAMMADLHRMRHDATLILPGIFDDYVPCAGGWSRLIERVGPARAKTLLLSDETIDAGLALALGLCEAIDTGTEDHPAVRPGPVTSRVARRLAGELSDRMTRSGGLTPRQSRLLERATFALAFSTEDPREGIAAFFEGRTAHFAAGAAQTDEPQRGAHR